jgi:hypothetical protein
MGLTSRGLKPVTELAAGREHGDRIKYMAGCRCMLCRAANSRYETGRAAARKNGDWNGIVSAKPARRHILKLARKGVGRRAIAAACDVADSIIHEIKTGRRPRIRKRTETRILAVSEDARGDKSLVPAKHTWVDQPAARQWLHQDGAGQAPRLRAHASVRQGIRHRAQRRQGRTLLSSNNGVERGRERMNEIVRAGIGDWVLRADRPMVRGARFI